MGLYGPDGIKLVTFNIGFGVFMTFLYYDINIDFHETHPFTHPNCMNNITIKTFTRSLSQRSVTIPWSTLEAERKWLTLWKIFFFFKQGNSVVSYYDVYVFCNFQNIAASYNKQAAMTTEDAKIAFLKAVYRWPTFGCAFFEVKVIASVNSTQMLLYLTINDPFGWEACLSDALDLSPVFYNLWHHDAANSDNYCKEIFFSFSFAVFFFFPANIRAEFSRYCADSRQQARIYNHQSKN